MAGVGWASKMQTRCKTWAPNAHERICKSCPQDSDTCQRRIHPFHLNNPRFKATLLHCCRPGRTPKALAVHRPSRSWEIHGRHLIHRPEKSKITFTWTSKIWGLRNVRGLSKPNLENTSWSLATTWEGPVCNVPVPSMSIPQRTQ